MDISETAENGAKSNKVVSVRSKSENAGKLVLEGKISAPMRYSKSLTEANGEAVRNDRTNAENRACRQGATSQPDVTVVNKGTSPRCSSQRNATVLVRNNRCRRWMARPPFGNPPCGYQTSFGRKDLLGHE